MITIQEVIKKSQDYLLGKGINNPRRDAEEVVSFSLQKSRIELYTHFDQPLKESELQLIRQNLARRAKHEPIQYIEGEVEFYNCKLAVTQDVLIPRQETELLVDKIVQKLKHHNLNDKVLWDIGTGSGAIAISLKKIFPNLTVFASDLSEEALKIARKNADKNQVEINFLQGDLFEPYLNQKADYIVSNPPYISIEEYQKLEPEVKLYEPKLSLVGGESGLECYQRISQKLKIYLREPGLLFLEIGYQQGEAVKEIFIAQGFDKVSFEKDFASHDRFFFLELE